MINLNPYPTLPIYLSIYLSIFLSIYISIYLSIYLSIQAEVDSSNQNGDAVEEIQIAETASSKPKPPLGVLANPKQAFVEVKGTHFSFKL